MCKVDELFPPLTFASMNILGLYGCPTEELTIALQKKYHNTVTILYKVHVCGTMLASYWLFYNFNTHVHVNGLCYSKTLQNQRCTLYSISQVKTNVFVNPCHAE